MCQLKKSDVLASGTTHLAGGLLENAGHGLSLQEQAYETLRTKIIFSELAPGTRLSAVGLEREIGIGRTPIRESFVRLREQELVETRPKSGTYVSKINMERVENACFVRSVVEQRIAAQCCAVAGPSDLETLSDILRKSQDLDFSERRRFFELDNLFHETLYRIAGKQMVWNWLATVNTHFERFRWLRASSQELDWTPIIRQHQALFEAIANGRTDEALLQSGVHLHLLAEEERPVIALHPNYFNEP